MAVAYVPDGTRVAEPENDQQRLAIELIAPGRSPGEPIDTELNPVLWPMGASPMPGSTSSSTYSPGSRASPTLER